MLTLMSRSAPTDVSVLLPAYNLGGVISPNVDRVAAIVDAWDRSQVVVVDDGSTDDTRMQAEKAAADWDTVLVVGYDGNRGKGAALKEGFRHATGDIIIFLDADLDLPPEQLPGFLDTFASLDTDVLIGAKRSAMTPGRYPILRRMLSRSFAATNRILFRLPVRETQTGLKVFRREVLETCLPALETEGYAFDLELLLRIQSGGGTMMETPVTLAPGAAGSVKVSTLLAMGRDTIRIWIRNLRH